MVSRPASPPRGVVVVVVHVATRSVLGGTVKRPDDEPAAGVAGATVRWRRPTRPGSRAVPLLRAVPCADRAGRGGSAESGAWRARAATTATAALGLACVHRGDVHGGRERAEVGSEHRPRGLALEGVHGPVHFRAHTDLNARHASQEPNSAAEFRRGRARGARARLSLYVRRTYERATPGAGGVES